MVVDTYGVPSYKEVNPAYFTAVTFPFFFGVMFGDIMHGTLLFLFGIYLCFAKQKPGSLAETLSIMRYFFLLMGFFALFCGFVYNDLSSMPTQIFGEGCYRDKNVVKNGTVVAVEGEVIDKECVYPFGMDPVWFRST
jgi:V-type H+-transporting ATPase subunit a